MIDRVVGNKPLPADIRQDIIERTDGIPLFVEEMTKAVLEAESESAAEQHGCGHSVLGSGGSGKLTRLTDGAARPARARPKKSRRSGRLSGASSLMRCWRQ